MADTDINELLISKNKPATHGMDYAFLRTEGLSYIEALSSGIWTDHNIHDPGITILEALAYALTDISARANRPVSDLLASKPGALDTEKDFFSAAEILPCSAVTVNDFRKMLIDQDKIRNAWLTKSDESEQAIYYISVGNFLSYDGNGPGKITLNGLYNVLLEFEEDEELGDLNSSVIRAPVGVNGTIEVAFPFWDEISPAWASDIAISDIQLMDVTTEGDTQLRPLDDANNHDFFALLRVIYNGTSTDELGITIKVSDGIDNDTIKDKLREFGAQSLIKEYNKRIVAANVILAEIKQFLNANRNLCEDFYAFKATRVQEIAVKAELEIAQSIDVVQTLAEIFYRLDNFFAPPIPFYTLEQMMAKPGFTVDQIFEGPLLKNGFIDDNDLVELKRNNIIYTSDLVGLIMSLNDNYNYGNTATVSQNKGIIAIKNLTVSNFINNQTITADVRNCLSLTLTDIYKPKLSIDKSIITIYKNSVEVPYDIDDVIAAFNQLKKNNPAPKATSADLEIPGGSILPMEDYYSIQNDFPLTYGIGYAGLPLSASDERKAQAKQLKGFLLFFEQLLANYLAQLAHVKDLFSVNAGVNETYFWQSLAAVPGSLPLLKNTYASAVPLLLSKLEQSATGLSRRNSFLDHLLARFGEDFTEYALLMYAYDKNTVNDRLITDKSAFLVNYANTSYNRSKSFNYLSADNWGTGNVPWLKRRICALLGIAEYKDQSHLSGNNTEGFYMVEHILLRPRVNSGSQSDELFNLKQDEDGNFITDPYSFKITFVFPNWPGRFTDADFRQYVEKIIQRETPAHILAEVHWCVDDAKLEAFETAYQAWLVAVATLTDPSLLSNARSALVKAINNLP